MDTRRAFHYSFKSHRPHRVRMADGTSVKVLARSAREATDVATAAGHDVVVSTRIR